MLVEALKPLERCACAKPSLSMNTEHTNNIGRRADGCPNCPQPMRLIRTALLFGETVRSVHPRLLGMRGHRPRNARACRHGMNDLITCKHCQLSDKAQAA